MKQVDKEKIYNECSAYLAAFEHFACSAFIINSDALMLDYNKSAAKLFFKDLPFAQNSNKKLPNSLEWIKEKIREVESDDLCQFTHAIKEDGMERLFGIKIKLLKNIKKEIFGYLLLINDNSEIDSVKEQFRDVQEVMIAQSRHAAMGEMIAMISHHWRQPLGVISMSVNNMLVDLELGEYSTDSLKQNLQEILEQSEYLSNTINDIGNFFRPQKEKKSIKAVDIVKEAYAVLATDLQKSKIEVDIVDRSSKIITLYTKELLQVALNILKNSYEALSEKEIDSKKISILVEDKQNSVLIAICDNAGGIAETIKGRVFEPYVSSKDTLIGTGLGLYISKIIVQKHLKGKIWFENKDNGVCFYIELPVV